jgi:hypothetical protein
MGSHFSAGAKNPSITCLFGKLKVRSSMPNMDKKWVTLQEYRIFMLRHKPVKSSVTDLPSLRIRRWNSQKLTDSGPLYTDINLYHSTCIVSCIGHSCLQRVNGKENKLIRLCLVECQLITGLTHVSIRLDLCEFTRFRKWYRLGTYLPSCTNKSLLNGNLCWIFLYVCVSR